MAGGASGNLSTLACLILLAANADADAGRHLYRLRAHQNGVGLTDNLLLNPICIYSLGFGIGGSALATRIGEGGAVCVGLYQLSRLGGIDLSSFRLNRYTLAIIRIGLPMCSGTLVFAGVYWALLRWVISTLEPEVNAALGIGFSVLEGFTWLVFWGFSMGIASIVGRSLGAGDIDKARLAIRLAFAMMTASGLFAAAVFWLGGEVFAKAFTNDVKVLNQAVLYAQILAFSQLFVAYEALAEGKLSGAGLTKSNFFWSASLNILRVPFAWYFALDCGYGPAAVWRAINCSTFIKTIGKWSAVLGGRWQA